MSESPSATPITDRLEQLICGPSHPTTDRWLDLAERAFTDTIAVLLAGSAEPAVRIVAELAHETRGDAVSVATGRAMSVQSAALVDGTSAHALDYDDVDDALIAHPSAVLVPALLAAAQLNDAKGVEALDAFRVGLLAGRLIASAFDITAHFRAGWHPTATIGTLAAAAAVSHLLQLPATPARHALGIAGSLCAGSRQNFGTMTKPLHVGTAASNGLTAARLAARGFTADTGQLEGRLGFLALHRGSGRAPAITVDRPPGLDESPVGINVKLMPCCYAAHAAAEAAAILANSPHGDVAVERVVVFVPPDGLSPLVHHHPTDGTRAKFSMEYVVAAALLDGGVSFASFTDERVNRPDVQRLLRCVMPQESATPPDDSAEWTGRFAAVVTVHRADGSTQTASVSQPIGHASRPLTEAQLRAKFDDCAQLVTHRPVTAVYEAVRHLRDQPSVTAITRQAAAFAQGDDQVTS